MDLKIDKALEQYIVKKISKGSTLTNMIDDPGSSLIEVIGNSGTGKSLLFRNLLIKLEKKNMYHHILNPHVFSLNQFKNFIQILTNISDSDYEKILKSSKQYKTGEKYDFFYYFSEQLKLRDYVRPSIIIIDDCNLLDQYTRDFIQYLINDWESIQLKIIVFTPSQLFTFSDKITLNFLTQSDIAKILSISFPNKKNDFEHESEIILNISKGSLYIVNHIVSCLSEKNSRLDISEFIDKQLNSSQIYMENIKSLSKIQQDLLTFIYLFDGYATLENLRDLTEAKDLESNIDFLCDKFHIVKYHSNYYVHKITTYTKFFDAMPQKIKEEYLETCLSSLKSLKLKKYNLAKYSILAKTLDKNDFEIALSELSTINDHLSEIDLLQFMFSKHKKDSDKLVVLKRLGLAQVELNNHEKAVDYLREYLHICGKHDLPDAEIIYNLSNALFSMNSSNFALEIIKKYAPKNIDSFWKAKIILLKGEILTEGEEFEEANEIIEKAIQSAADIDDLSKQRNILGDVKKLNGKLFYYINDYDKAADTFKEAETYYSKADNYKGLAAIYNNIGVLHQFKGEYDASEELYKKSLRLEKDRYNLKGISVCYNNLGGLMEDKGNRNKSLYYLNEAIKIQTLLNEPYPITNIYNNIGVTYMDGKDYRKSEDAFFKSLEIAINFNFNRVLIATYNNLGTLYNAKGDWDKAIEYYQKAIDKCTKYDDTDGLIISHSNLGEIYEKRGEFNIAYDLYFKGLELLPKINDENIKADLYGNIGSVLTQLHKFKEAYSYLVESLDFFKSVDAKHKIVEGCQKQAMYFVMTHNYESASYYINQALSIAEELNLTNELGRTYYLKAILEQKNIQESKKYLRKAIELFVANSKQYELAQANYLLATILSEESEWEQALQILKTNTKLIKKFGAIKLLEQTDILIHNIMKEHEAELKENEVQESLLNKFYEITNELGVITDMNLLLEESLSKLVDFADADGAVFCLYNNKTLAETWEYSNFKNFKTSDKYYNALMDIVQQTYASTKKQDYKQPHFAPKFNHLIAFPLILRNKPQGVILLMSEHGSHYFSERTINMISALCNQIIVLIENIRSLNLEKSHATIREVLTESNTFNIIGKSRKITEIFDMINKIKDTPTTILLEGPSGTGKELIARAIHYSSIRRNKAFIAQYCGALPETLLESELFGHVKGSFTGAAYDKKGLFELANGGTFFLDEIADISLSTQAKLLRFLQEGEIKRVGSTKTEKVNVRVVCATNVSLIEKVKLGEFRLDLYYRLNVIRMQVPSLKERQEDVPLLAIHFLDKYNKHINKEVNGITDEAMKVLKNYDWPGNVRQLENEIERAVTLSDSTAFIKANDLSPEVLNFSVNKRTISLLAKPQSLKEAVETLEISMISQALEESNWNQTQAAKILGLSRQGLIKKMKRYQLENVK